MIEKSAKNMTDTRDTMPPEDSNVTFSYYVKCPYCEHISTRTLFANRSLGPQEGQLLKCPASECGKRYVLDHRIDVLAKSYPIEGGQ